MLPYYAKDFCRITGLKVDTLRYYVDKGLLSPTVEPTNQYKQYSDKDVVDMFYVRSHRAMGVPILNINQVLTRLPMSTQMEWLEKHEQVLVQTLGDLEKQLRGCRKMQVLTKQFLEPTCEITEQLGTDYFDIVRLDLIGPGAIPGNKKFVLANRWRELYPHMLSCIFVSLESLQDFSLQEYPVTFGAVLPKPILLQTPELITPPSCCHSAQDGVVTKIRLTDPFHITRRDLQPVFNYIKSHKYTFTDDLTGRLVTKSLEDGTEYYYFAVRIPVRRFDGTK